MRNDLTIYDQAAAGWWSDEVRWVRILKNLAAGRLAWLDQVLEWPGQNVLDLGCAGGFMAEAIARRGARVTGIDPAAKAIEAARRHAAKESLAIAYDVGVGESLPYDDMTFDIVVCGDVLEHVADLRRVIAEVRRVLKPGGVFAYDTINRTLLARCVIVTLAEVVLRILPRGTHDPALFITPTELCGIFENTGLIPEAMVGLGPTGLDKRLDLTFGRLPFTGILYMGLARRVVLRAATATAATPAASSSQAEGSGTITATPTGPKAGSLPANS